MNRWRSGLRVVKPERQWTGLRDTRGLCLPELLVAMTAGAIVLVAVLHTFSVVHAQAIRQQRAVARQQDLRLGLEVFEQEVRIATSASIIKASPNELVYLANVSALQTTTTASVLPGHTVVPVQNGIGWGEGKTVALCGPVQCESHRLARNGQSNLLTLAEPAAIALPTGASVEVVNRVSYYAGRDDAGGVKLMRMVDGGASTVIGDLKSVQFVYKDGSGRPTTATASIKRIAVKVTSARSTVSIVRDVSMRS